MTAGGAAGAPALLCNRSSQRATRRPLDPRGFVAVVQASTDGPYVQFMRDYDGSLPHAERVANALRCMAAVYVDNDGNRALSTWPRAVWVQERPGVWRPA